MSFTPQVEVDYTPTSTVGALFIDAMQPWLTLPLAWLLDAAGVMFDQTYGIVADVGFDGDANYVAGYSKLLNPQTCPDADLPYLAQFVGARIPPGTPASVARQIIISEPGQKRGSPTSIVAAAQRYLSGTQLVTNLERTAADGISRDPDHFVLIVRDTQVIDASGLIAAVDAVRPAGVQWTLLIEPAWTIGDLEAGYSTISNVESTFPTIVNLETDVP